MAYKPHVTISKSSYGVFDECERKWALHYQRFKTPPEMRRATLYEYHLMGEYAFVGQLADDIITNMLRHFEKKQKWPVKIREAIEIVFDQYVNDTMDLKYQFESGVEEPKPRKRQPLQSLFFGDDLPHDFREKSIHEAEQAVRTWIESGLPERFASIPTDRWQTPPEGLPPSFTTQEGVQIWAKFDFAIHSDEGTQIYDWKTGKYKPDAIREQLTTYGMYAISEWGARIESLELIGVWLINPADACIESYPYDPDLALLLRGKWSERRDDLVRRLSGLPYEGGPALFERFPMTGFPNRCFGCSHRSCEGYKDAIAMRDAT